MKKALYTAGVLIGTVFLVTAGANEKEALELLPDYGKKKNKRCRGKIVPRFFLRPDKNTGAGLAENSAEQH